MDFMRLLKSLEELLYELVSWLVFYPATMWRSVTRPLSMMRYADLELADRPEDQYDDTLSPPLFLLITLLLSQALAAALPSIVDPARLAEVASAGSNLMIARGVIFGIYPLCMAVTLLRWKSVKLSRTSLRPPFFSQCFVAAPFVFAVGLGVDLLVLPLQKGMVAGLLVLIVAVAWYGQCQVRWFVQDLSIGPSKAFGLFLLAFTLATGLALGLAVLVSFEFNAVYGHPSPGTA
ncbi:permease [Rhizobium sp. Leaf341]|nr:permease [Rhizobium sp. Leaf341]